MTDNTDISTLLQTLRVHSDKEAGKQLRKFLHTYYGTQKSKKRGRTNDNMAKQHTNTHKHTCKK